MAEILRFPKVPELDWLKELATEYEGLKNDDEYYAITYQRLSDLHSYIKWSRIYGLSHGMSREHYVANGFVTKFHRRVFNLDMSPGEEAVVRKSEEALKASNDEIKRRKNANPG